MRSNVIPQGHSLNYLSSHPKKIKFNLVLTLKNRIEKIAHPPLRVKNIKLLYEILLNNSYPSRFLKKLLYNTTPDIKVTNSDEDLQIIKYSIPYIPELSSKIINVFKHEEIKSSHPVVILHNVSFDEVKAILSFMYRGQCVVSQEQLPSLLSVAKMLRIQGLCDMKIPDRHIRNDSTSVKDNVTEKITNEKPFMICDNNLENLRDRIQNDCINFKRHADDRIPISDFNANEVYQIRACFNDKAVPLINESIPMKFEDENISLMKKYMPRDSSETCKCFLCGKYLSNQYNLRVHMETHEEAFHACQSCAHVSRSRDALRKHVSYRHPEEYQTRKRKKTDT